MARDGGGYNPHPAKRKLTRTKPARPKARPVTRSGGIGGHSVVRMPARRRPARRSVGGAITNTARNIHKTHVKMHTAGGKTVYVPRKDAARILANSRRLVAARGLEANRIGGFQRLGRKPTPFKIAGVTPGKVLGKGTAAAVDILEETTRPLHGVAAAIDADFTGHGRHAGSEFVKGIKNERKTTFSDVLKHIGVKNKIARGVGGLALDVALDPTTYLTFGASTPARKLAEKEAERVGKKALKAGMSKEGVATVKRVAAQRAAEAAPQNKGLTLGFAGRRTSGKTTAKLSKALGVSGAAKAVRNRPLVQDVGAALRPDFRKQGVDAVAHDTTQSLAAERRASLFSSSRRLESLAKNYSKQFSKGDHQKIIDAVEAGKVGALRGTELHVPAVRLRSELAHRHRLERAAGVIAAKRENYIPHVRRQDVERAGASKGAGGTGKALGAAKARAIDRPLSEIRNEDPSLFTEDIPSILGKRGTESGRAVAHANFERGLADTGRDLKPDSVLKDGESIYHLAPKTATAGPKLRKLVSDDKLQVAEIGRALEGKGQPGRYVILNEKLADDSLEAAKVKPVGNLHRRYRKGHGALKTALTQPMPSYHLRNLYGDSANAYFEQTLPELAGNLGHSAHAMRELRKQRKGEEALTLSGKVQGSKAGVKIDGKHVEYVDLLHEAEQHGGLNAGFSRDLLQLLGENPGKFTKLRNIGQYRENLVRFATYTGARKQGLTAREAAKRVRELHFDYADLTTAERGIRDVIPFYTFSARNAPLQAKKLITRPGKAAAYEKVIEEGAKAAGLPPDWQNNLKDYQKLGVATPIPGFKLDGKKMLGLPSLPIQDLNRLTTNPTEQFFLTAQMATGFKALPEIIANYSIFFRGPIENDGRLVAAPDWLHHALPQAAQKKVGLELAYDKAQGKKVWKYSAKWDYALRQLPELSTLFNLTSTGKNRRGQGRLAKAISLSGVRPEPFDPLAKQSDDLYARRKKIEARMHQLNSENISIKAGTANAEYNRLSAQRKRVNAAIYRLTVKRKKQGASVSLPSTGGGGGGVTRSQNAGGGAGSSTGGGTTREQNAYGR